MELYAEFHLSEYSSCSKWIISGYCVSLNRRTNETRISLYGRHLFVIVAEKKQHFVDISLFTGNNNNNKNGVRIKACSLPDITLK